MTPKTDLSKEQEDFWNGAMGETWVASREFIDGMLRPFEELIVTEVAALRPQSALDVGCGNGSVAMALAGRIESLKRVVGVDISRPMVENARSRALARGFGPELEFLQGDAAEISFGEAQFDVFTSRFGVMFFADPVAAFASLRRAATPGARIAFVAWRSPDENEFLTAAQRAAAPLLPPSPKRNPEAPGAFALADSDRIRRLLTDSGWAQVEVETVDLRCAFPREDLDLFITKLAPIGHDLEALDSDLRAEIEERIGAALEAYVEGTEVRFVASAWMIRAHNEK